jgi:hypothetical protein
MRSPRFIRHEKIEIVNLVLLSLLLSFIVPHTVSARDLLLASNLLVFSYLAWRRMAVTSLCVVRAWRDSAGMTAWMYIVAVFVPRKHLTLDEIESRWCAPWWRC